MNNDFLITIFILIILTILCFGVGYLVGNYLLYKKKIIIICKSCGYKGEGIKGRNPTIAGTSLLLVLGIPFWTAIYFAATKKWRCPKCNSDQIKEENKKINIKLINSKLCEK